MGNVQNIVIDDGLKHFTFSNNDGEVFAEFAFNPADTSIIERYEQVVEVFNGIKLEGDTPEERQQYLVTLSDTFKEQFDIFLNRQNAEGLFKKYSPITIFANGDFFAEVILHQISKIIEKEFDVRLQKKQKRIEKYTKNYHK